MKEIKLGRIIAQISGILLGMIALGVTVSIIASGYIRKQAEASVKAAIEYYAQQIDSTFEDINDYLAELVFQDKDVALLQYSSDPIVFIQQAQKINEKLEFYRTKLGGDYQFLIYYPKTDYTLSSERGEMGIREFAEQKTRVVDYITSDYAREELKARKKWWIAELDGTQYAMNYIYFNEWYACCYIQVERLTDSINVIPLGEESEVTLVPETTEDEAQDSYGIQYTLIHHSLMFAQFGREVLVKNNQHMMNAILFQVLIALFILMGLLTAGGQLIRIKKQVMEPLKYFSDNLLKMKADHEEVYFDHVQIVELEEANQMIRGICEQMKEMKIQMYEQELEKQKLQIDFMHLQIQPHFYINCMSLIYNMAAIGEDDTIQQLSACVSDYFRYIFKSDTDRVKLTEELKHVKNYLEICKIRYKDKLTYQVLGKDGLDEVLVPPLMLHTFVENSVKYAVAGGKHTEITVAAWKMRADQGETVEILIKDNGTGFPEEVLASLKQEQDIITEKGTRIGISNCIRRLGLIYGEKADVLFKNRENGGASVRIQIPLD